MKKFLLFLLLLFFCSNSFAVYWVESGDLNLFFGWALVSGQIYSYNGSNLSLVGSNGIDIRQLCVVDGNLWSVNNSSAEVWTANDSNSWVKVANGSINFDGATLIQWCATNDSNIFVGAYEHGVWTSDNGLNWFKIGMDGNKTYYGVFQDDNLFVSSYEGGGGGGIFYYNGVDGNLWYFSHSWSILNGIDPVGNTYQAFESFNGSLYMGTKGGGVARIYSWGTGTKTWTLKKSLPDVNGGVNNVFRLETCDGNLFALTEAGLYTSNDGSTWHGSGRNIDFNNLTGNPQNMACYQNELYLENGGVEIWKYSGTSPNFSKVFELASYPKFAPLNLEIHALLAAASAIPKIDVWKADGFDFKFGLPFFSFYDDGNITIDFNVYDAYIEDSISVDINFSTIQFDGNGASIIAKGLTLNSSVCTSTIWNSTPICTWDWNILGLSGKLVPDGNFFITIKATGIDGSDFNASVTSIGIDNNRPITRWNKFGSTWYNSNQTITLTCNDNFSPNIGSGCKTTKYRLDQDENFKVSMGSWQNGNSFTLGDGNWRIDFNSTDNAGNVGDLNSFFLLIDANKPVTSYNVVDNNKAWLATDFNLQFSCREAFDANSGCNVLRTKINAGPLDTNSWHNNDQNIGVLIHIDGNTLVSFYSTDLAGNSETIRQFNIALDKVKPEGTAWDKDTNSWYTANQTVTLTGYDATSGVTIKKYRYKKVFPTVGAFIPWQTYTTPVVMDTDGKWHWEFYSIDAAGWQSDTNTQFFFLDKTKPAITSDANAGWNLMGDANLQIDATDATSGIDWGADANLFRVDTNQYAAIDWGAWQNFDANVLVSHVMNGDGNFAVQYLSRDLAGNDSNSDINGTLVYILLDVNGPEWPTSISPNSGSYTSSMTITCADVNWVRDLNYVFEFKEFTTPVLDWNILYLGPSNTHLFNFSYILENSDTNMMLRCKAVDADKNSGYVGGDFNLVVQPDTGFDTITSATPASAAIITSPSAPFTVYASDLSDVGFCTFQVYKNTVNVLDVNGTPPAAAPDTNNGTWAYTYTDLAASDIVYSYIFCQDNTGNTSAKVSTASYTYSPVAPPPSGGGGGGGGTPTIQYFDFTVTDPADRFIGRTVLWGNKEEFQIKVKNEAPQASRINVTVDENISKIVKCDAFFLLPEGKEGSVKCTISLDINKTGFLQETFEGYITLKTETKTENVHVKVIAIELGTINALILFIKENPEAFAVTVALAILLAAVSVLGIVGVFKENWQRALATFGGGAMSALLFFALII